MAEDGRTTELVRIRALPAEAAALRAEADRLGVTLSLLVLGLAADAGLVEHRGAPQAEHRGSPRSTGPDLVARIDALEARVLDLEARPARAAPATAPARPATAEAPAAKRPKRPPVDLAALPAGFPTTGAELEAWRKGAGLPRVRFGEAIGQTGESLRQQEKKGDGPLTPRLVARLAAAVDAGDLPAPG